MNLTDLRRKFYMYSASLNNVFLDVDTRTSEYISTVRGYVEVESRDEELMICFEWKGIGGKTHEEIHNYAIDIYVPNDTLIIERVKLIGSNGKALDKQQTTDVLISFLSDDVGWKNCVRTLLPKNKKLAA